jgi:hypothetical protein
MKSTHSRFNPRRFKVPGKCPGELFQLGGLRNAPAHLMLQLPPSMRRAMLVTLTSQGYGLNGKSRWIIDTLEAFLDQNYWNNINSPNGWKRAIISSEKPQPSNLHREQVALPGGLWGRTRVAAIESACFGLQQDPQVIFPVRASDVLRCAVMWGISTAPPPR